MLKIVGFVVSTVLGVAVIVYGSFALYEGSWSLAQHNANHRAELVINGFNYQSTLGQQITANIQAVAHDTTDIGNAQSQGLSDTVSNLKDQRQADAETVCQEANQINGSLPSGLFQTSWINANCSGGTLKSSSVFFVK